MQDDPIPYGYCQCGCGQKTNLAQRTNTRKRTVAGEPTRFVVGHGVYRSSPLSSGDRFGRLVVTQDYRRPRAHDRIAVRCDCGAVKSVMLGNLLRNTRSCGCLVGDLNAERGRARATHGHCRNGRSTRTYDTWTGILARCTNPNTKGYRNYGGRGIAVCDRWLDFAAFLADMGERPEGKTLDRINPNGGYEPGNCRWATPKEQSANTRRARGLKGNPTVREMLDEAGVPRPPGADDTLGPRVAHVLALLAKHGISPGEPTWQAA